MRRVIGIAVASVLASTTAIACSAEPEPPYPNRDGPEPERLTVEVVEVFPHDPDAFTQGLELVGDTLYEGTGLVGESTLRAGPVGAEPTRTVALPEPLFGEGITVVEDRVWQLTWRSGIAIERDATTLDELRRVRYEGEGWGLCHQPESDRLVMSDGTAELTFRDPGSFADVGSVTVTDRGSPVTDLNELECVGDDVYANVWHTDDILCIDPETGVVTARIDASGLLSSAEAADADVLNGIAADTAADRFLITGKLWPKMFAVTFVPAG